MAITAEEIKELRDQTGISVMQCKRALEEAGGDRAKALEILKAQSGVIAQKKGDRALGAGTVAAYIHTTKTVGALVTLSCETDFVAKNEEFTRLAYDIAMQVVATEPSYLSKADMPAGAPAGEAERVLLDQPFIKDPTHTIGELIAVAVQKFGERIVIAKFIRFSTKD